MKDTSTQDSTSGEKSRLQDGTEAHTLTHAAASMVITRSDDDDGGLENKQVMARDGGGM